MKYNVLFKRTYLLNYLNNMNKILFFKILIVKVIEVCDDLSSNKFFSGQTLLSYHWDYTVLIILAVVSYVNRVILYPF